ncbi:MAG: hypothetical protein WDW38_007562 [Sanguina aurantia]
MIQHTERKQQQRLVCAPPASPDLSGALHLRRVCLDQQEFISYDPQYAVNTSTQHVPSFNVDGIFYNWPSKTGNGDKYMHGHNIPVSPVVIRAATELEACPDLREPRFSSCTSPLVLYVRWPFNVGELFESAFAQLLPMIERGTISRRMTLVLATPHGLQLPSFTRMMFQTLFEPAVTTLADFSTRTHLAMQAAAAAAAAAEQQAGRRKRRALSQHHSTSHMSKPQVSPDRTPTTPLPAHDSASKTKIPGERFHKPSSQSHDPGSQGTVSAEAAARVARLLQAEPTPAAGQPSGEGVPAWMRSSSTVEGVRVRCFENVAMFKVTGRKDDQMCHCGAHVVSHYRDRNLLPSVERLFPQAGPGTLRVVFASRPGAYAHVLLNEEELIARCNGMLTPDAGRRRRRRRSRRVLLGPDSMSRPRSSTDRKVEAGGPSGEAGLGLGDREVGSARRVVLAGDGEQTGAAARWTSIQCIPHLFGGDLMLDLQLVSTADVLVCVHGAVCYNAFFMKEGAALIEVRRVWRV